MLFVLDKLSVWTKIDHGQKQDWTKSFGPKKVGRNQAGRKLGARSVNNGKYHGALSWAPDA